MGTEAKFVLWLRKNAYNRVCHRGAMPGACDRTRGEAFRDLSILDLIAIHGNLCLGR